jgi:hypothetical protein
VVAATPTAAAWCAENLSDGMAGVRVVVQEISVATETERELGGKGEAAAVLPGTQEVSAEEEPASAPPHLSHARGISPLILLFLPSTGCVRGRCIRGVSGEVGAAMDKDEARKLRRPALTAGAQSRISPLQCTPPSGCLPRRRPD